MVIRGKGAQPTDARSWVQAVAWLVLSGVAPLLVGCSSVPASINPVSWWHNMQGGEIAKQRPPPPGASEAYPNLATVPPRPEAPDQKQLAAITQGLVADRAHADYVAATAPLSDPSSPSASPALFGQGTMPPPPPASASPAAGSTPVASASLAAASAPPAPSGPPPAPSAAPRRPVQSTPLAPPTGMPAQVATAAPPPAPASSASAVIAPSGAATGTAPAPSSAPAVPVPAPLAGNAPVPAPRSAAPPPPASVTSAAAPAASLSNAPPGAAAISPEAAAPPAIPATPPAPPRMSGPGAVAIATNTPPAPLAAAPQAANAITVEFVVGSAVLPPGASDVLKGVAAKRGKAVVAVTGYGDATSSDPDAQTAALSLGLSRAQAVANVLTADGVPSAEVRVGAEAGGRGASVRLVQ